MQSLPVIDVAPLVARNPHRTVDETDNTVDAAIDQACREHGFFVITGHGVDPQLAAALETEARRFFERPAADKRRISMRRAGPAWRGWFPVGGELTSGRPDLKEGIYFGRELDSAHPAVAAGVPLHGPNQFPDAQPALRDAVLRWIDEMERLGQTVMRSIIRSIAATSDARSQLEGAIDDPTILFRIFHYPPAPNREGWGVQEHTDYGLLTLLWQDTSGGLEVHTPAGWIDAVPVENSLVCNLGDMLERLTNGAYRSTPHRVRPPSPISRRGRLSFPFFFDPAWDARLEPLPMSDSPAVRPRWDGQDPLAFDGTYGEYLTSRVARVFPELFNDALGR